MSVIDLSLISVPHLYTMGKHNIPEHYADIQFFSLHMFLFAGDFQQAHHKHVIML